MIMKQPHEKRQICYDHTLQIEAYQLKGIVQKFPNHFHECYVIGYVERGSRHLKCNQQEYALEKVTWCCLTRWISISANP